MVEEATCTHRALILGNNKKCQHFGSDFNTLANFRYIFVLLTAVVSSVTTCGTVFQLESQLF